MKPRPMSNEEIARRLERHGVLLEISGANTFRCAAFRKAADAVRSVDYPLAETPTAAELVAIPGVGKGIAAAIAELLDGGTFSDHEALTAVYPEGLIALVELPGIGPKRVATLHKELGIQDLETLKAAVDDGRIAATSGLGPKVAATIASGLDQLKERSGRWTIGDARPLALLLAEGLSGETGHIVEVAGALRRWEELVSGIDLVAVGTLANVAAAAMRLPNVESVEEQGQQIRVAITQGIPVTITPTPGSAFGTTLIEITGPAEHVAALALNGVDFATEQAAYASRGLPVVPPELRGDPEVLQRISEIDDLITVADIRGQLHLHSEWSDGASPIQDMVNAADLLGYVYLAVTDHSHSLGVANGLDRDRLKQQEAEIRSLGRKPHIFTGSEVEVRSDGRLDFDDETLASLGCVVASIHSGLTKPREELMRRAEKTLRNPHVDILAHPSGRLLNRREGGDFDWPALVGIAAETGTALEINADPARLDLNVAHAKMALEAGCLLVINCDAHAPGGFSTIDYGVMVARKAWARPDQVINTWPLAKLRKWLAQRGS